MAYISYIQDEEHYKKVIEKVTSVKKSLWIGTADIKDLHVKSGNSSEPFLCSCRPAEKGSGDSSYPC